MASTTQIEIEIAAVARRVAHDAVREALAEARKEEIGTVDFADRRFRNFRQDHRDQCYPDIMGYCACPLEQVEDPDTADLVCSDSDNAGATDNQGRRMHMPVIDIDFPAQLVPSGTPGHFHLYLNKPCNWDEYIKILRAFAEAGLVQWQWVHTTEERGYSSVRHPDRPKEVTP